MCTLEQSRYSRDLRTCIFDCGMVRTVERIDRELADLDQNIAQLGDDLYAAYQAYLKSFGQSLRQQYVLATHHICTQIYPEEFLTLSFSQRQHLQQNLMALVKATQDIFLASLHHPLQSSSHAHPSRSPGDESKAGMDIESTVSSMLFEVQSTDEVTSATSASKTNSEPALVYRIGQWVEHQDQQLTEHLRHLSWEANRLLQQAKILPPKLPEPLLEMTLKADLFQDSPTGVPNILDITLDTMKEVSDDIPESLNLSTHSPSEASLELDEEEEDTEIEPQSAQQGSREPSLADFLPLLKKMPLRFVAVHLNLTDIEFTDPSIATHRSQLRQLKQRLLRAEKNYRQKQHERAIVAAEDAWRASWMNP